jgi:phosphoribosyl 1,2-cyclic phosphodiesterase/DNA-binding response OmpR family regulator
MRVRFWGTRGSIAKPGPSTVRHGGNTSCVEVVSRGGTRLVLDCGTGAHGLGQALVASGEKPLRGHILIGHTHWDHIQGLPFFAPLFVPGAEWDIYAPFGLRQRLRETLAGQMEYTYFPVRLEELGATIRYHDLFETTFRIGDVEIRTHYMNHPAVTLGYRLESGGVTVVYATDHEPHARPLPGSGAPHPETTPLEGLHGEDRRHAEFIADADLLIHDAQYTAAEYPSRLNWGHSTVDFVVALARRSGVRRLALFHHDPMRDDDALDEIVRGAAEATRAAGSSMDVFAASEGREHDVAAGGPRKERAATGPVVASPDPVNRLALVAGDADLQAWLSESMTPLYLRILSVDPSATAIEREASTHRPALIVLARRGRGWDGFEAASSLRSSEDPAVRELPIVMVSGPDDAADMAEGFERGLTDWFTRPCSSEFIHGRVRAWLLRGRVRWAKAPLAPDEEERISALERLNILDTPSEERFDRIARLAVRALGVPFAAVHFIDRERQWVKASTDNLGRTLPRDVSMCAHVILGNEVVVVPDALEDPQHGDNPVFLTDHRVRFYAGVPLRAPSGHNVGTLCLLDARPRRLDEEDLRLFRDVAALAEAELRSSP